MERNERPTTASRWLVRTTATRYFALAGIFFVWAFIWLAWAPKPYAWIATVLWIVIAAVFAAQGLRLRRQAQAGEPGEETEGPGKAEGREEPNGPEGSDGMGRAGGGVRGGEARGGDARGPAVQRGRTGRRPAQPVHRPHHRIPPPNLRRRPPHRREHGPGTGGTGDHRP
ncbi:phage holin family protein [Streptomyces sp. NBC_01089]|uniref:phage holin family protein n=1 Tax=Streptomyces sp. NBC_01089 TaxID=2903747 RepID=UPI00386A05EE|nr:phage holin family protein [Streptomyces sp. NBC_01089]